MSEINPALSRAQFMRGPGSQFYNLLGHIVLPQVYATDLSIFLHDDIDPGYSATLIGEKFILRTKNNEILYDILDKYDLDPSLAAKLQTHTFAQTAERTMIEGLQTSVFFPINILRFAEAARRSISAPPVYRTFEDFVTVLRSQWFYNDICQPAAITGNGYWSTFSTDPYVNILSSTVARSIDRPFIYTTPTGDSSRFSFSPEFSERQRRYMKDVNAEAHIKQNNSNSGHTSGCPVAHLPSTSQKNLETEELVHAINTMFKTDTPPEETAIALGLKGLADMLERSYKKSFRKQPTGFYDFKPAVQ